MTSFTLRLQDATRTQEVGGVTSFVGQDASGSFGILAGHARMMTVLDVGLARFRQGQAAWEYLALPGAVLYFRDDVLALSTRRYLRDTDYNRISLGLQERLLAEEETLRGMKDSLRNLEQEVLKRLWRLGRPEVA